MQTLRFSPQLLLAPSPLQRQTPLFFAQTRLGQYEPDIFEPGQPRVPVFPVQFADWSKVDKPLITLIHELDETPVVKRLNNIQQLSFIDTVYPGATHSRRVHSYGAADKALFVLQNLDSRLPFNEADKTAFVLAAFLHDVGHGPYSHQLDNALKLLPFFLTEEERAKKIIETDESLDKILKHYSETHLGAPDLLKHKVQDVLFNDGNPFHGLMSGDFDIDKIDYLNRDQYYTGLKQQGQPDEGAYKKMLMSVQYSEKAGFYYDEAALPMLKKVLHHRLAAYKEIYFDPAALSKGLMLSNLFQEVHKEVNALDNKQNPASYLAYKETLPKLFGKNWNDSSVLLWVGRFIEGNNPPISEFLKLSEENLLQFIQACSESSYPKIKRYAEGFLDVKKGFHSIALPNADLHRVLVNSEQMKPLVEEGLAVSQELQIRANKSLGSQIIRIERDGKEQFVPLATLLKDDKTAPKRLELWRVFYDGAIASVKTKVLAVLKDAQTLIETFAPSKKIETA